MNLEAITKLTVHMGPMFSDKTSELIRAFGDGEGVVAFKPQKDDRYAKNAIVSHNGKSIPALNFNEYEPFEILALIPDSLSKVIIDEVQFCGDEIIRVVQELLDAGLEVVVAGLDYDSDSNEFGPTLKLARMAEELESKGVVVKHQANCSVCGAIEKATKTYADKSKKHGQVVVGGVGIYRPCCPDCYDRLRSN